MTENNRISAIERIHQFNKFGMVLGLERMNVLLDKIGNPHSDLKVIHVAGTNGKGSVSKFLEEGLRGCGYKIGLYSSPFIEKFNERMRFDGEDISDEDLEKYSWKVIDAADKMVEEGLESPTEFELVTAIAFLYFKEKKADITVLEVGLGGSGDSTNVVEEPLASVICSISFDHMDRLGNTLAEIAADKAGIIKSGCPVISNVPEREASVVIAKAAYEKKSQLYDISKIKTAVYEDTPFSQKVSMELYEKDYSDVKISMVGKHQAQNLKTALATLEILRKEGKVKLDREKLYDGLENAKQPGRFEVMHMGRDYDCEVCDGACSCSSNCADSGPMMIIDGAHNEAGAAALQETMQRYFEDKRILLVTGMLADKQVDEILGHFVKISGNVIATEPDNPRKLGAEALAERLKSLGADVKMAADADESVRLAKSMGSSYDVVLFAGSLYLIGSIRRILKNEY